MFDLSGDCAGGKIQSIAPIAFNEALDYLDPTSMTEFKINPTSFCNDRFALVTAPSQQRGSHRYVDLQPLLLQAMHRELAENFQDVPSLSSYAQRQSAL